MKTNLSPNRRHKIHRLLFASALMTALLTHPAFSAVKTLALISKGAKTNYQMQFLRLHKGSGTDSVSGGNDALHHVYLGSNIDDDFFGVRFYEADGTTPIIHRRMICKSEQVADFILKVNIPAAGETKKIILDYAAVGRTTKSSDAALENIHFYGWVRQGAARNGMVHDQWGVENSTLVENGKIRMWWHGSLKGGSGDYFTQGVTRYSESTDGLTWTDMGAATGFGPLEMQPFVYKDSDGLYHMMTIVVQSGQDHYYRYLTSTSGKNGTWTIKNRSAFTAGGNPGNMCFWKEGAQWHMLYEWLSAGKWVTSYAYGPALDSLSKYNEGKPVMSGAYMVGGPDVVKSGSVYYMFGHAAEHSGNLPTSATCYTSPDLKSWTRAGWLLRRHYHARYQAQVADPSIKEFKGKTFLWYESQPDQSPTDVPWLSVCTWDQPLDRMLDRTITTAVFDDLEAEGWVFDKGYGENNTDVLGTVFRKLSDRPSPISENCVIVKTEPGRQLRIRKSIGALASENVFEFYARAEQVNKKFEALRIDKDKTNGILAGVWFDADGKIKYYRGTAATVALAYDASVYYRFQLFLKSGGYDLKINGSTIANDIPYYSAYAAPAYFYIGQDAGAVGYISGLYTRQYSDSATEPVWAGVTETKVEEHQP